MKKSAAIFLRNQTIFISASARTTGGLWIEGGPVHAVDASDVKAVAALLRAALSESRYGVSPPLRMNEDLTKPLLEAAGVKTWGAFARGAKHARVDEVNGVATITPYRRVTKRGNYEPQSDVKRTADLASEELGATILQALDAS